MNNQDQLSSIIGFRPSLPESMKITYIGLKFELNKTEVIRELLTGQWTLNELYSIATKINSREGPFMLSYIKAVYTPSMSVEDVVDGTKQMVGRQFDLVESLRLDRRNTTSSQQVGHSEDGVHRGADFMTHVG